MNNAEPKDLSSSVLSSFAHYRKLRKIGQGGMSIVYEGFDDRLKRSVAIKVLHPFLAQQNEYKKRFLREAEAIARLTHPNIMQIYDISNEKKESDQIYLINEFLKGKTLKEFIESHNLRSLPELCAMIIWQLAQALEHAHQKGIVHRDIKPENIMVCHDGMIKIMDFGIASFDSDENLTNSGALLGTLSHVAPEIIKGEKSGPKSDIYSLTTVFYWLVTNSLPFIAKTPHALLKAIVEDNAKEPQSSSPFISDELSQIIATGMQKDPDKRFRSAAHMADAIEQALLHSGIVINPKKIIEVLREPEKKLGTFEKLILSAVEKQIKNYQENNEELKAISLQCRLSEAPNDKAQTIVHLQKKPTKRIQKKFVLLSLGFFSCMTFAWYFLQGNSKSPKIIAEPEKNIDVSFEPSPISIMAKEKEIVVEEKIKKPQKIKPKIHSANLDVVITPFATVFLNGRLIKKNTKNFQIKVREGLHRLTFTHEYAATVEKIIEVEKNSKNISLNINLTKTKPAFLVIRSNVEADVAVDDSYKGSTSKSMTKPIVIPLPDRTHSLRKEIIIQRDGYKAIVIEKEFTAGKTLILELHLVKENFSKPNNTIDEHAKPSIKRFYL